MRNFKLIIVFLLIYGLLASGHVLAGEEIIFSFDEMSPYLSLNNKGLMIAFGLKMQKEHVLAVLRANRWNQTAAAKVIGTYHQKISKLLTKEDIQQIQIEKKSFIIDALEKNKWNVRKTALSLNMAEKTIRKIVGKSLLKEGLARQRKKKKDFVSEKEIQDARVDEKMSMLSALIRNQWDLSKAAASLNTGQKRVRRIVGQSLLDKGRARQRQKEIDAQREIILYGLQAYRWNVLRVERELGISKSKIYEFFTSQEIQSNRNRAQDLLKDKIISIMEKHGWVLSNALKDQVLKEEEISKHTVYSLLGQEFINEQRQQIEQNQAKAQKQEILQAINIFINSRNCLREVAAYLGIPRGTLNDRLRKHDIAFYDIKHGAERVIPVLLATGANLGESAKILQIDRGDLIKMFPQQIAGIKAAVQEKERIKRIGKIVGALRKNNGNQKKSAQYIGITPNTLYLWIKKYKVKELSEAEKDIYWIKSSFMDIDSAVVQIKTRMNEIDTSDAEAVKLFTQTSQFRLYCCIRILENIEQKSKEIDLPNSLRRELGRFRLFLDEQYDRFGSQNKTASRSLLRLKLIIRDIDIFKTEGRAFYSEYDMFLGSRKKFTLPVVMENLCAQSI